MSDPDAKHGPLYSVLRVLCEGESWDRSAVLLVLESGLGQKEVLLRRDQERRIVFPLSKSELWEEHLEVFGVASATIRSAREQFGATVFQAIIDTQVDPHGFGNDIAIKGLWIPPDQLALLAEAGIHVHTSIISA